MATSSGKDHERIQRILFRSGRITAGGISRKAHAATCTECDGPLIVGLDGDRLAFTARADPWPIDVHGEVAALLLGRRTWSLTWAGTRYELDPRTAIEISATSPDRVEVLAEHRCGQRIPPRAAARRPSRFARAPETFAVDPPF